MLREGAQSPDDSLTAVDSAGERSALPPSSQGSGVPVLVEVLDESACLTN